MQVLAGEIEDAAEDLIQLLRRAVLALVDETEKIALQLLPRDVRDAMLPKLRHLELHLSRFLPVLTDFSGIVWHFHTTCASLHSHFSVDFCKFSAV